MVIREAYLERIRPFIDKELVKVLVGARRSGKTVLLAQIKDYLMSTGVSEKNFISINFESMKFGDIKTAERLYEYVQANVGEAKTKFYIFLDEIQEVENWQLAVNSFPVDFNCDIYITGSNSKLLSGELSTYLARRYVQIKVFPFTFWEARQIAKQNKNYVSDEQTFRDYLKYGGFPGRFQLQDDHSITTYLFDIYEAVLIRNIINRHNIKDIAVLRNVLNFLLDNIGNPFSARKITGKLLAHGIKIANSTLLNYIEYFKEAFIILNAGRYDIKGKELLSTTEKYYAVDLGIRNVVKKSEDIDISKLFENAVYLEMMSRGYEVLVGKLDDKEIDFICYRGQEKLYIQVAYLINDSDREREFGNLEQIHDNYPKYVVSADQIDLSRNGIIHKNIMQFLLEK